MMAKEIDSGLICLGIIANLFQTPFDLEQIKMNFVVKEKMDKTAFLRAAQKIGFKAKLINVKAEKIPYLPLPAVVPLTTGDYIVLLKADEEKILVFDPHYQKPITISQAEFSQVWSEEIILMKRRFSWQGMGEHFNLNWFIPVFGKYKRFFLEVIVASFFLQIMALVSPLFTQVIIDKVLVHRGISTLDILVLGILIISLFNAVMSIVRGYLLNHTTNKIDAILGAKLFRHITALPLRYFELRRVGDTVARVRELENIRQFITGSALTVILDTFFALVFIVVMFAYNTTLSIIALLALPIYILLSIIVTPLYRKQLQEQFNAGAESHSYLVETVTGIQTVKSLNIETKFNNKWEEILAKYVKISFDTSFVALIASNIGQFIQSFFNLIILWYGARLVMAGNLSVGQLIAFQMLAGQVNAPVLRLVNLWQSFQQTRISVERLGDILNSPLEPAASAKRSTLPVLRGDIEFVKTNFRYRQEGSLILNEVTLDIPAGSRIGIVGRSGSGKSTIAKLIQRLYLPNTGHILIDGVDLGQIDINWLRRHIGVVLQDSFLFNGTVRENIAITKAQATMEEIVAVAKLAGAHDFILELPEGYDTSVGERGTSLSGGQKQRIAIARALLNEPKLIIFDEATSALDYESERLIMQNMDKIAIGRTVIMIAHRLSSVKDCDKIFVLEQGRIVESGNHTLLMQQKGLYHYLYTQQERK